MIGRLPGPPSPPFRKGVHRISGRLICDVCSSPHRCAPAATRSTARPARRTPSCRTASCPRPRRGAGSPPASPRRWCPRWWRRSGRTAGPVWCPSFSGLSLWAAKPRPSLMWVTKPIVLRRPPDPSGHRLPGRPSRRPAGGAGREMHVGVAAVGGVPFQGVEAPGEWAPCSRRCGCLPTPLLRSASWEYVWLFRSMPVLVQLLFHLRHRRAVPDDPRRPDVDLLGPVTIAVIGLTRPVWKGWVS